jgi:hypothetical protein
MFREISGIMDAAVPVYTNRSLFDQNWYKKHHGVKKN